MMSETQFLQLSAAVDSYHAGQFGRRPTELEMDCIMLRLRKLTNKQKQELIDCLPDVAIGHDPVKDKLIIVARKADGSLLRANKVN